jgi:Domain of unknown function (DUF4279)
MSDDMAETNIYCMLTFRSESEPFYVPDFEERVHLYNKLTWSIGDLQHPNYYLSARTDSSAVIKSAVSDDYDGTSVIKDFFQYLQMKKVEVLQLKHKYKASLYFDIVINLESSDSPVVFLMVEHLALLTEIGASINYSVYDYK